VELSDYFIRPVGGLGLHANAYGVRYPEEAQARLAAADIRYLGWIPNYRVPQTLRRHRATIHIPRRSYAEALPGIPTIRVFEALACGVPLVCSPWNDVEGLFRPGKDFLMAGSRQEMKEHLRNVIYDRGLAREITQHGLETIRASHTCAHRVDELLGICNEIDPVTDHYSPPRERESTSVASVLASSNFLRNSSQEISLSDSSLE